MEIIGHQKIVESLKQRIENKNYSQAYIFSGPEGVGKYFVAQEFARGLVLNKNFLALSEKERRDAALDIILVSPLAEEKKGIVKEKEISIKRVLDAQRGLSNFPYSGKTKVLIVNDSDRMTVKAQNAMLKTIEEPNSTAVIILITSQLEKILLTIKSRCQIINFNLVKRNILEDYLASQGRPSNKEIIDFSMGRPGMIVEMIQIPEKITWYRDSKGRMREALRGTINEKLKIAENLSKNVPEALAQLNFWLWLLQESELAEDILRAGKIAEAVEKLKNTNASARLLLDNLFLSLG